ncbi:hypothetical protein MUS1_11435 [Marinomonas ushuaiensis DSM 15871]|uniref:Uncharacterized protein n=1 Tax=Marinomonas ushuaiensis DSM 15871 TaxID=1122207 RepID=X7E6G4_9GAMM|nr:hypothetical protein [Marinomonas ushuaiensis]ETX11415.1 hypothetical protein MUS1_11435 [Marinomonas ushuaiensis DSM 15871]
MKKLISILFIVITYPVFANADSLTSWSYEKTKDAVTGEIRENILGTNDVGIMYVMCISKKSGESGLIIGFKGYYFEVTKNKIDNRLALKVDENSPHVMSGNEFLGGSISINQEGIFDILLEIINGEVIIVRLTDDKNINQNVSIELNGFMPKFMKTVCWADFIEK